MNRVLITGAHGYIGTMLVDYLKNDPAVLADGISLRGNDWKTVDFSPYDSVVHLAGIAHRKETNENRQLYYDINRDLSIAVAEKAKREHVKQFVFISTMAVYGKNSGVVTKDSPLAPITNYGKSKLEAEMILKEMETDTFRVCIIRPPMVYGPGCKGNFQTLIKLAERLPVFPKVDNRRSMIYIDNLCEFIKRRILECGGGVFPVHKTRSTSVRMRL